MIYNIVIMKKNYLTKEGYEQLIAELNELKKVKLPSILERLGEAKAMGDLSENFEYKSALEDKDFTNSRISEIETLIDDVEIIKEEKKSKSDKEVDYGSKVTIQMEDDDIYNVTIVGTGETTMDFDKTFKTTKDSIKISLESPIGLAIKGKKAGDTVKMRLNNERKEIRILDVKN
ncbi:MAG: GreA/GreB family elongation factor [candidate division SR1 bacterium]|nr:GreA/GreB family elongation factor [candidate division SR1 bacterium]